tara:strand:+ start:108 stop:398 length:291 start_codon:yes stop_codon:yes gene_type:complete
MTKTELKRQQTKEVIELLENQFSAENFDNDEGSYFTFNIGDFSCALFRRDFSVSLYDTIQMGPGFTDEEYAVRDAAIVLEKAINKRIKREIIGEIV